MSRYTYIREKVMVYIRKGKPLPCELAAQLLDALNNCETALNLCEGLAGDGQ